MFSFFEEMLLNALVSISLYILWPVHVADADGSTLVPQSLRTFTQNHVVQFVVIVKIINYTLHKRTHFRTVYVDYDTCTLFTDIMS